MARPKRRTVRSRRVRFEVLEPRTLLASDFGDAPSAQQSGFVNSYPTLARDLGASHVATGPQLGASRSASPDGQPAADAQGDVAVDSERLMLVDQRTYPSQQDYDTSVLDLNGDGWLDVMQWREGLTRVSYGDGQGWLAEFREISGSLCAGRAAVVADLNGDRRDDLVLACATENHLQVALANPAGEGLLVQEIAIPLPATVTGLVVSDLDRDGVLDLATSHESHVLVTWHGVRDGNGIGFPLNRQTLLGDQHPPSSLAAADVDADGWNDLLVGTNLGEVAIFRNQQNGRFAKSSLLRPGIGMTPQYVSVGDLNRDGKVDVVARGGTNEISVFLAGSNGDFAPPQALSNPTTYASESAVIVDVDGDGDLDLAGGDNQVWVARNEGNGRLAPVEVRQALDNLARSRFVDMNRDGRVDLLAVDSLGRLELHLGSDTSLFQMAVATRFVHGENPEFMAAGDFNGDGLADIVTAERDASEVLLSLATDVDQYASPIVVPLRRAYEVSAVLTADFNRDGITDIATVRGTGNHDVSLVLGNRTGEFVEGEPISLGDGRGPVAAQVADLNADGFLDMVTLNSLTSNFSVLLGRGDGTFWLPIASPHRTDLMPHFALGDVTGDGALDLVASTYGGQLVTYEGNGLGYFASLVSSPLLGDESWLKSAIFLVDANHDGWLDVVTGQSQVSSRNLEVLTLAGQGDGRFILNSETTVPALWELDSLLATDLDLDGDIDVVLNESLAQSIKIVDGQPGGHFGDVRELPVESLSGFVDLAMTLVEVPGQFPRIAVASSLGLDLFVPGGSPSPQLPEAMPWSSGALPTVIEIGDVNGDTHPDLVTANADSFDLSVVLGRGDGTWGVPYNISLGSAERPADMRLVDLNHDGKLDVVTVNEWSHDYSVLLGLGNGGFSDATQIPIVGAGVVTSLAVADYNVDGHLDLAARRADTGLIVIHAGNGDGTFRPFLSWNPGIVGYSSRIVTADFNADQIPDLAIKAFVQTSWVVVPFVNRGDGTFWQFDTVKLDGNDPTIEDLDQDGRADIVANKGVSLAVRYGMGTASFQPSLLVESTGTYWSQSLLVSDVNRDGDRDIVALSHTELKFSAYLGQTESRDFARPTHSFISPDGWGPMSAALADINHDGHPDMVYASRGLNTLVVAFGQGDGTFQATGVAPQQVFSGDPVLGDLNGDGVPDLARGSYNDPRISVALGRGDGSYGTPITVVSFGSRSTKNLAMGDVTSDGRADLVVVGGNTKNLAILAGNGDGTFQAPSYALLSDAGSSVGTILRDFDGDGRLDLIIPSSGSNIEFWRNRGDATFELTQAWAVSSDTLRDLADVELRDLNHDGRLDVVVLGAAGIGVGFQTNESLFGSAVYTSFTDAGYLISMAIGDVNGDGWSDVVATDYHRSRVELAFGTESGLFQRSAPLLESETALFGSIELADIDSDRDLDVLVSSNESVIEVFHGDGKGMFERSTPWNTPFPIPKLIVADLNRNARPDLVLSGYDLVATVVLGTSGSPEHVSLADLNPSPQYTYTPSHWIAPWIEGAARSHSSDAPSQFISRDLDGDGVDEFIAISNISHDVSIMSADDRSRPHRVLRLPDGFTAGGIVAGDFTGDGRVDLIATARTGPEYYLWVNLGEGAYQGQLDRLASTSCRNAPMFPLSQAVDLDQDGRLDLVSTTEFNPVCATVASGRGDGTFSTPRETSLTPMVYRSAALVGLQAADVTGDGWLDLVVQNWRLEGGQFTLFTGTGDGSLKPPVLHTDSRIDGPFQFADFNGDGRLDLAGIHGSKAVILFRDANGEYTHSISRDLLGSYGTSPVMGISDLNADGRPDLVIGRYFSQSSDVVLMGNGNGVDPPRELPAIPTSFQPTNILFARRKAGSSPAIAFVDNSKGIAYFPSQPLAYQRIRSRLAANGGSSYHRTLLTGDVNEDGRPDVISISSMTGDASVLLGDGVNSASVGLVLDVPTDVQAKRAMLIDWNRDGHLDLLIGNNQGESLMTWLGRGDGTFLPSREWPLPYGVRSFATADLNQDGWLDVVAVHGSRVSDGMLLLTTGPGEFAPPRTIAVPAYSSRVLAGNFTGDTIPDLAIINPSTDPPSVWIVPGLGNGVFAPPELVHQISSNFVTSFAAADLNGDGQDDLVVGDSHSLISLLSTASGGYEPHVAARLRWYPDSTVITDFDLDGHFDLLTATGVGFVTHRGDGGGHFTSSSSSEDVSLSGVYGDYIVADWNGDTYPDVVGIESRANSHQQLVVRYGSREGIVAPRRLIPNDSYWSNGKATGDFDGDGLEDLVVSSNGLRLFQGRSDGTLAAEPRRLEMPSGFQATVLAAGDFNGDDRSDLAAFDSNRARLLIQITGDSGTSSTRIYEYPADMVVLNLLAADLDGDGRDELIGDFRDDRLRVGTWFGVATAPELRIVSGIENANVVADFNGDRLPDLADISYWPQQEWRIALNDGNGSFRPVTPIPGTSGFNEVARAGDLDQDGKLDLVWGTSDSAWWMPGDGQGGFREPQELAMVTADDFETLHLSDLNQDGRLDLIFDSRSTHQLRWIANRGNGQFDAPATIWDTANSCCFTRLVLDVNHDGADEYLAVNNIGESLEILQRNRVDDDGVWLPERLVAGNRETIWADLRNAGPQNRLDAWIDFNRDGDWDDPGEKTLSVDNLQSGWNPLDVSVPLDAVPGRTFARFRLSSAGGLAPTGPATDGEVEDYAVEISAPQPLDFGDALYDGWADPARHVLGGPRLGARVDRDVDPIFTTDADGDDRDGLDDDDGVRFPELVRGTSSTAWLTVTGAEGRVDVWIDFNRDEIYDNVNERVVWSFPVLPDMAQPLSFYVPPSAVIGTVTARVRVSSSGVDYPHGWAADGEVEDYQVTIADGPPRSPDFLWYFAEGREPTWGSDNEVTVAVALTVPTSSTVAIAVESTDPRISSSTEFVHFTSSTWSIPQFFTLRRTSAVPEAGQVEVRLSVLRDFSQDEFDPVDARSIWVLLADIERFDYGDAPTADVDDARHRLTSDLRLGSLVDADTAPDPNPTATGDDPDSLAGPGDPRGGDDGVYWLTAPLVSTSHPTNTTWVVVASDSGYIDAWADFDRNGRWAPVSEQLFAKQPVSAGVNLLTATIPAGALAGDTMVRFRLSSQGGLAPTGEAEDGEVEDYVVSFLSEESIQQMIVDLAAGGAVLPSPLDLKSDSLATTGWIGEHPLFSLPRGNPQRITVLSANGDDEVTWTAIGDVRDVQVSVAGGRGNDVVRYLGAAASFALPNRGSQFDQPETFDLRDHRSSTLVVTEAAVRDLTTVNVSVTIEVDAEDRVEFERTFRPKVPVWRNGNWYHQVAVGDRIVSLLAARPFQNPVLSLDANASNSIEPLDVLWMINALNSGENVDGTRRLLHTFGDRVIFLDTTGDGYLTPLDVLLTINYLNRAQEGEGEEGPTWVIPSELAQRGGTGISSIAPPNSPAIHVGTFFSSRRPPPGVSRRSRVVPQTRQSRTVTSAVVGYQYDASAALAVRDGLGQPSS